MQTGEVKRVARSSSPAPTRKVAASAIAGALTTLLMAGIAKWQHHDLPPGVGESVVTLVTFLAAYLTNPKAGEVIEFDQVR